MIKLLRINNIALISRVELDFEPGFTLLTGETGTGKSILVDSLGLLLGARASAELIRTGEDSASVEAIVEAEHAGRFLEARGVPSDGGDVVLRREITTAGKGRASVNGALVPIGLLKDLAPLLCTLHGQHEPQGLLDPATHLEILDRHAGLQTEAVGEQFARLRECEARLAGLRRDRRELERRRETLEFQGAEIDNSRLQANEEQSLRQEKLLLANAERLAGLSAEAYAALYEDEGSVLTRLGQVYKRVEELAAIDPRFAPHLDGRTALRAQLNDLALFLRDAHERIEADPGRLDEIEARLALVERLKRKYGATLADVMAFGEDCRRQLAELLAPEEQEQRLETERGAAAREYLALAGELSARRRAAARELERRVEAELAHLAMERTRFRVRFEPEVVHLDEGDSTGWTASGLERAEFLLSPNPGEELRPLARIASGGELSRILLALNAAADVGAAGGTLVFDEVDAGIGGRVAEVVGRKLKALAGRRQVLCVTHLPQIAALADQHYVVRKRVTGGRTLTDVGRLSAEERVEEIARMLGGESVTDAGRRHAREMVAKGDRP